MEYWEAALFTGLIQALGTREQIGEDQVKISCHSKGSTLILGDLALGDSVAVDGVCLTVVEILSQGFIAVASPETLYRSTLGQISYTQVNLETSLRAGSKLGGHFVTGHVDGMGCLQASVKTASAWEMRFTSSVDAADLWQHQIAPYIVTKGSIAVNGISLTVADCDAAGNWFQVAVIPHTFAETNLCDLQIGSLVNIEADILGKYVAKFMSYRHSWNEELKNREGTIAGLNGEEITPEFLLEHGFI